jgi:mono/diheme cytochrome c family protein
LKKIILTTILVLACFVLAYANADTEADEKAKALFEEKCDLCHGADYSTDIKNTEEEWRVVVVRMREDNGADMTDEEAETIIKYLSTHYGK